MTLDCVVSQHSTHSLLCEQDIDLNAIYNQDLLKGIERSALAAMNSKAQALFVQTLVDAILTCLFCTKNFFDESDECSILGNTKAYYGCYECAKNDQIHIHV